jgi:hypothetical protein
MQAVGHYLCDQSRTCHEATALVGMALARPAPSFAKEASKPAATSATYDRARFALPTGIDSPDGGMVCIKNYPGALLPSSPRLTLSTDPSQDRGGLA